MHCNADLKFATLVERAAAFDAAWVATGHYARVAFDEDTRRYRLLRGADPDKDQSYFLFFAHAGSAGARAVPVGHLTKPEVRSHAERLGPDRRRQAGQPRDLLCPRRRQAADFVERQLGDDRREGDIVDTGGKVLGQHRGLHRFTVGQRKGLGLSIGVPLYVVRLDPADARVVVGSREELGARELTASSVNWISGTIPAEPQRVTARIRHRHQDAPATVTADGADRAHLHVRRAANRRHARTGGGVLRGRGRDRRRMDEIQNSEIQTGILSKFQCPKCSRYRSASIAAMQPEPAAVIACR